MGTHALRNVVLVHGGFVDGSSWEPVYKLLKKDGYPVTIVQNPTTSLADDVAATKRAVASADGPVILVGHSYGGVVITEAGNDPKVAGLVYIAAFAPDEASGTFSTYSRHPGGIGGSVIKVFESDQDRAIAELRRLHMHIATPPAEAASSNCASRFYQAIASRPMGRICAATCGSMPSLPPREGAK